MKTTTKFDREAFEAREKTRKNTLIKERSERSFAHLDTHEQMEVIKLDTASLTEKECSPRVLSILQFLVQRLANLEDIYDGHQHSYNWDYEGRLAEWVDPPSSRVDLEENFRLRESLKK